LIESDENRSQDSGPSERPGRNKGRRRVQAGRNAEEEKNGRQHEGGDAMPKENDDRENPTKLVLT